MKNINHICYIHILSYGVLRNIGVIFDHRFIFDMKEGELCISKNKSSLPNNFWGAGIYSLTAIIGNNGSGKTTILQLMKKIFVEGMSKDKDLNVIIVYENDGRLSIYNPTNIRVHTSDDIEVINNDTITTIETFYYSSHFQPYMDWNDIEFMGSYEATDSWLLIKDLQDYSNVDTLHLSEPLYNHLLAYYAQNNYRICEILLLQGLDELLTTLKLPKMVRIVPNKGGWNAIKLNRMGKFEKLNIPGNRWRSIYPKDKALEQLVYYNIINMIAEGKGNQVELDHYLKQWVYSSKPNGVLCQLETDLAANYKMSDETKDKIDIIRQVIEKIDSLCDFDQQSGCLYINVENSADNLKALIEELLRQPFFLTAKFFDIEYGHNLNGNTRLSSGEQELLNLLSRLYYGITLLPQKFGNKEAPRLLLLDEAEIGFHPGWQKQYIKVLIEFMKYMRVKTGVDFQIVITSHSPIILSDIPVCCVNFLKRKKEGTIQIKDEQETFGENIFNLYRRAFFMEDGLIGTFAYDTIKKLADDIKNKEDVENLPTRIRMIGDTQVRNYLTMQYAEIDNNRAIALLEEQIRQIKEGTPWN